MPDVARRSPAPLALAVCAALVAVVHVLAAHRPDLVSNDGIQYLEGARSLVQGHGFGTSILVYDPNFHGGTLPTPQTTFPPGYSLAIAGLHLLGAPWVLAGVLVSLAALLVTAGLLFRTLGGLTGALAAAVLLGNLHTTLLTTVVASDVLFTACATAALLQTARAGPVPAGRRSAVRAGLWAACAVGTRFAGVFLLAALGLVFGLRWLRHRTWGRLLDGVVALAPGAIVLGALFVRNFWLTGDADGGALDAYVRPWPAVMSEFFWGAVTLFGVASPGGWPFFVQVGLTAAGVAALAVALARSPAAAVVAARAWVADPRVRTCVAFAAVYLAGLLYLSHTRNSIVLLPRYLLPLLPPLSIGAGVAIDALGAAGAGGPRLRFGAGAAVTLGFIVGSWSYLAQSRQTYLDDNPARRLTALLDAPGPEGVTFREAVAARLAPEAPLLAEPGHALGFTLGHPTVGPIGSAYSARAWDADEMRAAVDRYGIDWAVHVRGLAPPAHVPRFWRAVETEGPPPWLVPEVVLGPATLYRVVHLTSDSSRN